MPVVQVMRRLPGLKASSVSPENREGARKATAHLIATGHRRIAFVGGVQSMSVRDERIAGYRLAIEEGDLSFDPSLVVETPINYSGGGSAVPQLLHRNAPATSALCFNDVVAIGLLRGLAALGALVGNDFGVIGFDDIEEARYTFPALSSVAVNGRNLGARAVQLLMRQLASGDFEPETVLCPTTLIVRASCGAAPVPSSGVEA
jgi:LacI family transcriptional regulator